MRIVSFLLLMYLGASAFLIAIIIHSGLPPSSLTKGSNLPIIPIIICIINLLLAVYSIFKIKNVNPPFLKRRTFTRWFLIAIGAFILFCSFTLFSVSLFSPYLFGSEQPVPQIGVICSVVVAVILSVILYFASKMNTTERPNLFRYIAMGGAFFAVNLTSVQCLMLIYAVPVQPPTAFPSLSGVLTIAYIPFSLLLLSLAKDYVSIKK